MMSVTVGDEAPDFELPDQHKEPVRLSDFRGSKNVVIVFHPLAFSGICTSELCGIRDSIDVFRNDNVETLAISVDSHHVHRVWGEQEGYDFPLLSDFWPHGAVAQTHGIFNDGAGLAECGTFIVDKEGTAIFAEHNGLPEERDLQAWKDALESIGAA